MATVHVTFRNLIDFGAAAVPAAPRVSASITSAATSAATTIAAMSGEVAIITASGGDVYLAYGAAPVAVPGAGDLLLDGQSITIGGLPAGSKIAAIDPAT